MNQLDDIRSSVNKAICSVLPGNVDNSRLTETTTLRNELGLDSMAFILLASELQNSLDIDIDYLAEHIAEIDTVGDVYKHIMQSRSTA